MKIFTEEQPEDGDVILHCGHVDGHHHWFRYDPQVAFQRPDGTHGKAAWFAACEPCFAQHGMAVAQRVRGDGVWTGDAPAIEVWKGHDA